MVIKTTVNIDYITAQSGEFIDNVLLKDSICNVRFVYEDGDVEVYLPNDPTDWLTVHCNEYIKIED